METIGIVVPIDYLSILGGASQRIKADVAALIDSGYNVEIIFPSRNRQSQKDPSSGPILLTYPNIQSATLLPEKIRLIFDMYTQMINPFFHSVLRKCYRNYPVIFAHSHWSVIASYNVVKQKVPIIYVAHNFEYGLVKQATHNPLIRSLTYHIEKSACQKATMVLCVSEQDRNDLKKAYDIPTEKLALLPNTADTDFFSKTHDLYDKVTERQRLGIDPSSLVLLFHGRMDYSANLDALKFITAQLVPGLRHSSVDVNLVIAGAQIPGWCFDNTNDIISFYSDVPDMRQFLSVADAVIVPLDIGGGTRLKILESFAVGVPVISTAKGAEGINCQDGYHIVIAQRNADDFIQKIKMLAEDKSLREKLVNNAYDLVVQEYGIAMAARCLQEAIIQAQSQAKRTEYVQH